VKLKYATGGEFGQTQAQDLWGCCLEGARYGEFAAGGTNGFGRYGPWVQPCCPAILRPERETRAQARKQVVLEGTQHERLVEMTRSIDRTVTGVSGEYVERRVEKGAAKRRKLQALARFEELGQRVEGRGGCQ
jgi:hypothetical protein